MERCSIGSRQTIADIIQGMREEVGMEVDDDAGTSVGVVEGCECTVLYTSTSPQAI